MDAPKEVTVEVACEDGKVETLTIREMPVARYQAAMRFAKADPFDELGLLDLAFTKLKGWSLTLTPAALGAASEAMYSVNGSFFGYAARSAAWAKAISGLSPS